ncbi:MAG TPA: hypothetical protein VER58_11105 [Thermoanaerobaculia bacterium]|nr:hypothetical protein [Thermoanaerobaculia bacterium]
MLRPFLATLLFAAPAVAQTPQSVRVLVPIVGSVTGPNEVRWKTDVELRNDSREEMFVALRLPTAPDQPTIAFTLPANGTQRFADVVGQAFGMDAALSPLIVETMGKRSVRVSASAYAIHGTDVTRPEAIPIVYSDTSYPFRTLNNLSFSDVFRTNIGLVNLGEHEATFTLALQRVVGRNIAVARISIPANSLAHTSIQSLFPLIAKGDDFNVVVETSAPNTYVYASVVENATSEARFIAPSIGTPESQALARNGQ